jgi:hypothetical protein
MLFPYDPTEAEHHSPRWEVLLIWFSSRPVAHDCLLMLGQ